MAKPLRKTPTLVGSHADEFVRNMILTERRRLNKTEEMLLKLID
ncbi:MAG: hypothetical protein ACOCUR_03010 [Nanoarchaeota archaeon]